MNNGLEGLSKFRNYLIKNCKHLNTGRSPVFILSEEKCIEYRSLSFREK